MMAPLATCGPTDELVEREAGRGTPPLCTCNSFLNQCPIYYQILLSADASAL